MIDLRKSLLALLAAIALLWLASAALSQSQYPNWMLPFSGGGNSGVGSVSSVSNSDSTLTISPTTGAVVASLNLGNPNTWTGIQTFTTPVLGAAGGTSLTLGGATLSANEVFALDYSPGANVTTPGFGVVNANPASTGNQQSACSILSGQGWKTTATAASQEVDDELCAVPVQGAASPTGGLQFRQQINGGGFASIGDYGVTNASQWRFIGNTTFTAGVFIPSGSLSTAGLIATGTKPTLTYAGGTCAGGTGVGGSLAGTSTLTGACAATNTLTLSALPATTTGYSCDAEDRTTPTALLQETSTSSTTAVFTFSGTTGATDVLQFKCMGY